MRVGIFSGERAGRPDAELLTTVQQAPRWPQR